MAGAIKTDFILSAEIMTIALSAIPPSNIYMKTATLAVVAVGITVAVYGSVALIVKADDVGGLLMSNKGGRWGGITRAIGRGIVKAMPGFMKLLTIVGTAAMLWSVAISSCMGCMSWAGTRFIISSTMPLKAPRMRWAKAGPGSPDGR